MKTAVSMLSVTHTKSMMDEYRWQTNNFEVFSSSGNEQDENSDRVPPAKRQRVSLACSACRTRKSKCSGTRPTCELCERMDFECIYEMPASSANLIVNRDIITNLEDRVQSIEQYLKRDRARPEPLRKYGRDSQAYVVRKSHSPVETAVRDKDSPQSEPLAQPEETDGMGISFVNEEDCGYYGPSSNIALMRHVFAAMGRKDNASGGTPQSAISNSGRDFRTGNLVQTRRIASSSDENRSYSARGRCEDLPPSQETERLIRAYFSNTGLLFPYIHEQSFWDTYKELKEHGSRGNVSRTWLGLLNMVLAMATYAIGKHEDEVAGADLQSDVFFARAKELCKTQVLRGTTLEIVQFLLLTSQYLQGSHMSLQTWTTHGLAVKAALSIGLHAKNASTKFSPLEQEIRKRTWFGCVVLDRSLCMTFGRPSTIPEDYVRLPLPTIVPGDGDDGRCVTFFNATIQLYKILWKVMGSLYAHNIGGEDTASDTWMMTQIFQLEQELSEWQNGLPAGMTLRSSTLMPSEAPEDIIGERYRVILTMRYLNTKLLLHRPVFVRSLGATRGDATSPSQARKTFSEMRKNFNAAVVRSAAESVSMVHCILTSSVLGKRLLGAWWFTLFYVFHASLAIFGSALIPADEIEVGTSHPSHLGLVQDVLEKAIVALKLLDTQNVLLDQCVEYLSQLLSLINTPVPSSSTTQENPPMTHLRSGMENLAGCDGTTSFQTASLMHPDLLGQQMAPFVGDPMELGPFFNGDLQWWMPSQIYTEPANV